MALTSAPDAWTTDDVLAVAEGRADLEFVVVATTAHYGRDGALVVEAGTVAQIKDPAIPLPNGWRYDVRVVPANVEAAA